MKLLITPSNPAYTFVLFDTVSGQERRVKSLEVEKDNTVPSSIPTHRPFGVTWDTEHVYLANRHNLCVYDQQLNFVNRVDKVFGYNPHQLTYYQEQLVACVTSGDCIAFIDTADLQNRTYFHVPSRQFVRQPPRKDTQHINSVVTHDDLLYINLHNRGKSNSQVAVFCLRTNKILEILESQTLKSHNLCLHSEISVLDTEGSRKLATLEHELTDLDVPTTDFARGLVCDGTHFVAAHFERRLRRYRGEGDSILKQVDVNTRKIVNTYRLQDIGAVNDMRVIDRFDFCHHNPVLLPCEF